MITTFLQIQADTLSQVNPAELAKNLPVNTEISVLEFIFKGGFFLVPIVILFIYTIYIVFERHSRQP
jgi:biopolymer transport protein ExbB